MSGIFNEKTMTQALEKYLPDGESLTAGIHGVGIETHIRQVFGNCTLKGDNLIPNPSGAALEINKSKFARYDVYISITQHYLILAECEVYKHLYEFNESPELDGTDIEEIHTCIPISDIGTRFPLVQIQKCEIKKGWMGSVNCVITMKNGSSLKLMLPKRGGLGGGMPHHAEYREAIFARLSAISS